MARKLTGRTGVLVAVPVLVAAGATAFFLMHPSAPRLMARSGSFVRNGEAGFVVTQFAYALGPDTEGTAACPQGMSKNVAEIFELTPEGKRKAGEGDEAYSKRLQEGGNRISATADGQNYCMHPELAPPDPYTRILLDPRARAQGIDLDGKISRSPADAASGRLDFTGLDGTQGIDNQFRRLVGCSRSFQSSGSSNGFATEMYTGSWGILILLDGVDDTRTDDSVTVSVVANSDPLTLSPTRKALEYATYAMDQDKAFRATAKGRIKDGKLTTEPMAIRLHNVVNGMYLQRTLRSARIEATLSPDGVLKGYLSGYAPLAEMYDNQFGYRNGKEQDGTPSPMGKVLGSANGAARVLGHTCQGVWQAMHKLADGDRDPKTGAYTSISTQYAFEARPAFVVDVDTRSKNALPGKKT